MSPRPRVSVLGAGSWGTALAALACTQADVMLWARDAALAQQLHSQRQNPRYLPDVRLPDNLRITHDLTQALNHACERPDSLILLGVPVAGLRQTCTQIAPSLTICTHPPALVWTCKGFEPDSARLPHEMVQAAFSSENPVSSNAPDFCPLPGLDVLPGFGVLSGPSFAREVAQGLPVALTIASRQPAVCQTVIHALHGANARIYTSNDVIGTEVGGALKNIVAIACGISDALGLGTNARAALITRGLAEMQRLGIALGGQPETFFGLTGLGDLVLTATGELSRNRQVGLLLGQGQPWADIARQGKTAEGARCARAALMLGQKHQVDLPITQTICQILFDNVSPGNAVTQLLSRQAKPEHD